MEGKGASHPEDLGSSKSSGEPSALRPAKLASLRALRLPQEGIQAAVTGSWWTSSGAASARCRCPRVSEPGEAWGCRRHSSSPKQSQLAGRHIPQGRAHPRRGGLPLFSDFATFPVLARSEPSAGIGPSGLVPPRPCARRGIRLSLQGFGVQSSWGHGLRLLVVR